MAEKTHLTPAEIEALLREVTAGSVTPQTAMQLLVVNGHGRAEAETLVWRAMEDRLPVIDRVRLR